MAKKSNMVRAGKAAKKERRLEEQKNRMKKAENEPLRLREVVPPYICVKEEILDDEMEPVAVLTGEKSRNWPTGMKSGMAADPHHFGKENLQHFQDYWRKKLSEAERDILELQRDKPEDLDQKMFEARVARARIQAAISYLDSVIGLARYGMPVLPQCRKLGYFKPGRRVMTFTRKGSEFISAFQHKFFAGTVSKVSADGTTVTVRLDWDIRSATHSNSDPCYLTFSVDSMRVMRMEEYEVLLSDSYLRGWLSLSPTCNEDLELVADMKEQFELNQIKQRVGNYEFVAKVRANKEKI